MPYFDHNATSPLAPLARDVWLRCHEEVTANPSSLTRSAARAKARLEAERERLADYLGAKAGRVVFTSGATEGVQALFAYWARTLPTEARVWLHRLEHPCVLQAAEHYLPGRYDWLSHDAYGVVGAPESVVKGPRGKPAAVVLMAANNETGVLQPWEAWAAWCAEEGVEFFCDATQWLGKLSGSAFGAASWVVGSAHKWGGPRGLGVLLVPERANAFRVHAGGSQEGGRRGGTEDVAGVAAAVAVLVEHEQKRVFLESERVRWRDDFLAEVRMRLPGCTVVGHGTERLWNTVSLTLPRGQNTRWVTRLDKLGWQVSTGSACAAGQEQPSHVLAGLGLSPLALRRTVRISAGWETTPEDWRGLLGAMESLLHEFPADEVT